MRATALVVTVLCSTVLAACGSSIKPQSQPLPSPSAGQHAGDAPGAGHRFNPQKQPKKFRAGLPPLPAPGAGKLAKKVEQLLHHTVFRVASFNVLGASHTGSGGRHSKYGPGAARMHGTVQVLKAYQVSVVGLQEFQPGQQRVFAALAGDYRMFPGPGGNRLASVNSIAWRASDWELVEAHYLSVPYFHGHLRPMPYVLLEHRDSGRRVWFVNTHNPADAHGPAQAFRNAAVQREAALVNSLHSSGTPVVLTGDMNDRAAFFCPITGATALRAAAGGSHEGGCRPPANGVDWILGTPEITFTRAGSVRTGITGRISDHPFVYGDVSLG